MSAQVPTSFTEWLANLPVGWLVAGPNGSKEAAANGAILDGQVALVKLATKAHMPGPAPSDALSHIGGDRQLEQGPTESDASFRIRLRDAWASWSRAGTAVELLAQLAYGGFAGAVIAQQNGILYSLSGAPTPGVDPTPLLVVSNASGNSTITGTPPWWTFDGDNNHASRFAVLFPVTTVSINSTTVTFTGTEDGSTANPWPVATWRTPFPNTTYKVLVGPAYSSDPVFVTPDGTTKTATGIAIGASGPFVGSVDVLGYEAGANPFADILPADLARLSRLINRWRPAKALCAGAIVIAQTPVWGYPTSITWGSGLKWGAGSSARYGV